MTTLTTTPRRIPALPSVTHSTSLKTTITNTWTMAWRHLVKMLRTPEQFADVLIQPIFFTLMFTYIFGGAIAGDVKSYLPAFIPGIIVQGVITTSTVTGSQIREDMDKGVFDRFRSMPMSRVAPLAGAVVGDIIRYVMASVITLIVGMIIGYRPTGGVFAVIAALLLVVIVSWCVSWIFAFIGVAVRSSSAVMSASMLVMFPLTFISNIFVSPDTMPSWLAAFVKVNPISHLATAMRDLMTNGTLGADAGWTLLGAVIVAAIFIPLTVTTYVHKS